jgi:cellobiose-specific phosphotransferase system component IIC
LPVVYFFAYLFWFAGKKGTFIVPDIVKGFAVTALLNTSAGLAAFANLWKASFSFVVSVCPSVRLLPLDRFSWNLILSIS